MTKHELDLDDLNFLEDNEFDTFNANNSYFLFKRVYNLSKFKLIIVTVIGVILLITIIYYWRKIFHCDIKTNLATPIFTSTNLNTNIHKIPLINSNQSVVTVQNQNTTNILSSTIIGYQQQTVVADNIDYTKSINELIITIGDITNALTLMINTTKELQQNLQKITYILGNVKNKISNINFKISHLINNVDNLSLNIKRNIEEELTSVVYTQPNASKLFSSTSRYVLHAIIHGRAWLKSESGEIITITEGELLNDYGKIVEINPNNYFVRTSSGVVIR